MIESILVGVDETSGARRALQWAAEQAHRSDTEVVEAVHVLTPSTEFARDLSIAGLSTWRRELRHCLQHEWVQPLEDAGVTYRTELVEDDTVEGGLLSVATRDGVGLIVLGAHGNGALKDVSSAASSSESLTVPHSRW